MVKPPGKKARLDTLLVERGLAESRARAQALIMARSVTVDGNVVDKAGKEVDAALTIEVTEALPFVSRGGLKLDGALKEFDLSVEGLGAIDIGSSTGGFTDCLLQRGARSVVAIDVGKGIIDWKLRNDERVKLLEGRNIRHLDAAEVKGAGGPGYEDGADLVVIDVSFISLKLVLPKARELLKAGGKVLALVKPQFEVGKGEVGKGGIVRDAGKHAAVMEEIKAFSVKAGFKHLGECRSAIKGAKGNIEFWLFLEI